MSNTDWLPIRILQIGSYNWISIKQGVLTKNINKTTLLQSWEVFQIFLSKTTLRGFPNFPLQDYTSTILRGFPNFPLHDYTSTILRGFPSFPLHVSTPYNSPERFSSFLSMFYTLQPIWEVFQVSSSWLYTLQSTWEVFKSFLSMSTISRMKQHRTIYKSDKGTHIYIYREIIT